jgi:hypothetical protein
MELATVVISSKPHHGETGVKTEASIWEQLCRQTRVLGNNAEHSLVHYSMIISAIRLRLDLRGGLYLGIKKWLETLSVNRNYEAYGDDDP